MNYTLRIVLLLLLLTSCRRNEISKEEVRQQVQQQIQEPEPAPPPILTFEKVNKRGVLIGYGMELLDSTLNEIQDISDYNELMVDITAVSKNYHSHYNQFYSDTLKKDPCQKFRYVKIKTRDFEGIVEGQYVYSLVESPHNKIIKTADNKIEFLATSNYGAKNSEDEEAPCEIINPILFRDKRSNYEGLITLINREDFGIYFPYLEVEIDAGKAGENPAIKVIGNGYELTINTKFRIGVFKGDDPAPPTTVYIRRESNGKFIGKLLSD